MVDYKELEYLRKKTLLGPIALLKIEKLKTVAEKTAVILNQIEHCKLGVDYNDADTLEFNYRFNSWKTNLFGLWSKYGSHMDFDDFAKWVLYQNANKESVRKYERKLK